MNDMEEVFGPVISSYSRAQAIEDGVLVDLTPIAEGLRYPVAVTRAVWGAVERAASALVLTGGGREAMRLETKRGRGGRELALLLTARSLIADLRIAARRTPGDTAQFEWMPGLDLGVLRVVDESVAGVKVWSRCGPGDDAAPVLTVMLEGEN